MGVVKVDGMRECWKSGIMGENIEIPLMENWNIGRMEA
jgi:hypothetical protein